MWCLIFLGCFLFIIYKIKITTNYFWISWLLSMIYIKNHCVEEDERLSFVTSERNSVDSRHDDTILHIQRLQRSSQEFNSLIWRITTTTLWMFCIEKHMIKLSDICFEANRITKEDHRAVRYMILEGCHNCFSISLHWKKYNDCTNWGDISSDDSYRHLISFHITVCIRHVLLDWRLISYKCRESVNIKLSPWWHYRER
jgi:hypothetical protein